MSSNIKKILLIENNLEDDGLLDSLLEELDEADYQISKAGTISDALACIDAENFAVAILDISLEDGDGLMNITQLLSTDKGIAVIALSEAFDENDAQKILQQGAQDYLVKGEVDEWRLSRALKYAIEQKHQQAELREAHRDQLTELANKSLFLVRIEHAVHCAKRRGELVAMLHLDLDQHRIVVNDLGEEVGDALLIEVANRLTGSIRTIDTISRLKKAEFAIIIEAIKYIDNVHLVAGKIISKLAEPFTIKGHNLFITASMGVAFYPHFGLEADSLIRNADYALNQARNSGGNQYKVYGSVEEVAVES